jgi:hypothetical protein
MSTTDGPLTEADVRRIVQEEIAKAFGAFAREADHQDGYDADTIESYALRAVQRTAEGTAVRVTCLHEASVGRGVRTCRRCGEPEPVPSNPFEEDQRG